MKLPARLAAFLGQPSRGDHISERSQLREFVYLDEVSVYSLLASRKGSIPEALTETATESTDGAIEGSLEASAVFAKATTKSRFGASVARSNQVVRKSIIQGAFRELYAGEHGTLKLASPEGSPLGSDGLPTLDAMIEAGFSYDPAKLARGDLIELDVELEPEPLFKINAVLSAILEIVQENLEVFGIPNVEGIAQARTMNRILDRLLTGLVPLRGRATEFVAVEISDREWIVHRSVLESLEAIGAHEVRPLVVVAVAEQRLFWKDIRRVLFSNSRYTALCRVSTSGLGDTWNPVKVANVIRVLAPEFEAQLLTALGESAVASLGAAGRGGPGGAETEERSRLALDYVAEVTAAGPALSAAQAMEIASAAATDRRNLELVDEQREFFRSIQVAVENTLGVPTPAELQAEARIAALGRSKWAFEPAQPANDVVLGEATHHRSQNRYLDTEVVAIYW